MKRIEGIKSNIVIKTKAPVLLSLELIATIVQIRKNRNEAPKKIAPIVKRMIFSLFFI